MNIGRKPRSADDKESFYPFVDNQGGEPTQNEGGTARSRSGIARIAVA